MIPLIGDKPVGEITAGDCKAVLAPIWLDEPETARRVKQRLCARSDLFDLRRGLMQEWERHVFATMHDSVGALRPAAAA